MTAHNVAGVMLSGLPLR